MIGFPPSIRVYQPTLISSDFIADYGSKSTGYRQTTRLTGGWWNARWDMTNYSDSIKLNFYNKRIGSHVAVVDGGALVWAGIIWEIELYDKGVLRRVSLDKVRNAVKCIWTNQNDDTRNETSWYENDESIARYGRIEEIVYLDYTYLGTAQTYAQTILEESSWPVSRVVSSRAPEELQQMQLRVTAVGYAHTLNYKYVTISDTARNIGGSSGAIDVALSTDSQYVTAGKIAANAQSVKPPKTETRLWDWLTELTEIGDGASPYSMQVYRGKKLIYDSIDPNPSIFWDGKNLRTRISHSTNRSKYRIRPGVLRDLTWNSSLLQSSSFLQDRRDSIVTEVESGMDYDAPILKADDYNDSDLLSSIIQAQQEFEESNKK